MNGKMEDLTGMTITAQSGIRYKLTGKAGFGAQGVVYEESTGKYMVKFYFPTGADCVDQDTLDRLRFLQSIQLPGNFVDVVDIITKPYIGYVMDRVVDHVPLNNYLIPDRKMSLPEWYNQDRGFLGRVFAGYIIAKSFAELEKNGLSYCDISGNNILVRIGKNASVKMIDIDNIYVAGKGRPSVLGTPRYIAPEVIQHFRTPDVLSDNYALAVILFELLRVGHPYISDDILDGTPEDEENAFAGNADYVTDDNSTNMLPAEVVFTDKLSKLFEKCFVDGKKNRLVRPSARDFEYALLEASNKLIQCPSCGAWHFPRKNGKTWERCPWCDAESEPAAILNFYDMLFRGKDYQHPSALLDRRHTNSYVLKEHMKNIIKGMYVLQYDDQQSDEAFTDNYVVIGKKNGEYLLYNQFCKDGIGVRRHETGQYERVLGNQCIPLHNGDEIYFEVASSNRKGIRYGTESCYFMKMARFTEVKA